MSATLSKTFVKTNCVFRSGNREDEGAAGDHCVVELAVGDLRAVKFAAAIFTQAKCCRRPLMLLTVLLATLVQTTVRYRAGPCCPHCLPRGADR